MALGASAIGLVLPGAARAIANPWDKGDVPGLKPEATCKPKGTCACNCMPDGFGGYKERTTEVKPVAAKVMDAIIDDDGDADIQAPSKPKASIGNPPPKGYNSGRATSTSSSAPALSFDDLVANSVRNKEEMYGRKLSEAEVNDIKAKVAKFTGK
eukprot:scaffold315554_cov28-Tisochrysis_lutea.AAC.2